MTLFYSLIFLLAAFLIGSHSIKPIKILMSIFPIGGNAYWFVTNYLVLYIFIDYINCFLRQLTQKGYLRFLTICFVLWSIIPTLTIKANYGFSNLGWFIFMYSIGAYLKIFNIKFKTLNCIYLLLTFIIIQLGIIYTFILLGSKTIPTYFFNINNIYQFIIAFSFFNIFNNLTINKNTLINKIASSVFAIYIIHDNLFVRPYLWHNILHIEKILYLNNYVLITFFTVFCVFCFCIIIDKICYMIYNPIILFVTKIIDKYCK